MNDTPSPSTSTPLRWQIGMPADAATVRGLLQAMAATGEWAGLAEAGPGHAMIRVRDTGAGASQVEVEQRVPTGRETSAAEQMDAALSEARRRLLERTDIG
jgi:hypothetical protein